MCTSAFVCVRVCIYGIFVCIPCRLLSFQHLEPYQHPISRLEHWNIKIMKHSKAVSEGVWVCACDCGIISPYLNLACLFFLVSLSPSSEILIVGIFFPRMTAHSDDLQLNMPQSQRLLLLLSRSLSLSALYMAFQHSSSSLAWNCQYNPPPQTLSLLLTPFISPCPTSFLHSLSLRH